MFTKSLIIEDGGIYSGKCVMEQLTEEIIGQLPPAKTEKESTKIEMQNKSQKK
jgi:hypothetical protein